MPNNPKGLKRNCAEKKCNISFVNTLCVKHISLDCVSCLQKIILTPTKAIKLTSHFHIKMRYVRTDTPPDC